MRPQERQGAFLIVSHRNDQRVSAIGARRFQDRLEGAHIRSYLFEVSKGDHGTTSPESIAVDYSYFANSLALH